MIINQVVKGGGTTPTGTIQITTNGTHDVTNYASANVQVPTTAPTYYRVLVKNENNKLINDTTSSSVLNLTGVTDIGDYVFSNAYKNNTNLTGAIDMSGITQITGGNACNSMFALASNITSVDLSGLVTVNAQNACSSMFNYCTSLTSADLSALTTIGGNGNLAFQNMFSHSNLQTIDISSLQVVQASNALDGMLSYTQIETLTFSSLTTLTQYRSMVNMCNGCSLLKTVTFPVLNNFVYFSQNYNQTFGGCPKLESVSFGGVKASTFSSYKDQFQYMFNSTTGSTAPNGCTVHFPSNLDPSDPNHTFDASTLTGYPTFGGNANYIHVAFDLPATE